MTPIQIGLVKRTWSRVAPIANQTAADFYARLFELDPSLRCLFNSDRDLEDKRRELISTINTVVGNLNNLGDLVPAVEDIGRRCVDRGVKSKDYGTVGDALLWFLGRGLGREFTVETRAAWAEAYTILADVMRSAAARPAAA